MTEAARRFLLSRKLAPNFVEEILEKGLTDDVVRELERKRFSYDDVVIICKILNGCKEFCQCSTDSDETTKANLESEYLRKHFGQILPMALHEIIAKKPSEPIEYLGQRLLSYKDCDERERRRREFEAELLEERAKYPQRTCVSVPQMDDEEEGGEVEGHDTIY